MSLSVGSVSVADVSVADVSVADRPAVELDVRLALLRVRRAARGGGLDDVTGEEALLVVEAVEVVKAWADSVSVAATAVLVGELEADHPQRYADDQRRGSKLRLAQQECRRVATREIQTATGMALTAAQDRVWLAACESERTATVRSLMAQGRLPYYRALTLTQRTQHLDAAIADRIAGRVLAPVTTPGGQVLPGQAPLSQATFYRRLGRQLLLHESGTEQAERCHGEALRARDVRTEPQRDGTGLLIISADGPRVAAAAQRVDTIARRLRTCGDERTLAQLRSDVATDLLMRGWVGDDPMFTQLGAPPAAVVQVLVSLPTLFDPRTAETTLAEAGTSVEAVTGVDGDGGGGGAVRGPLAPGIGTGLGEISGWGPITAAQTRALALAAGSLWARVVTDPLTGRAIEQTAGTYRVPKAMQDQVTVRDGVCRAPGCQVPAQSCDLDHNNPWAPDGAGGATCEANLSAKHRAHHNLKTSRWWHSEQHPDGVIEWTTATGRTYTTYPYVYDHPDDTPIQPSSLLETAYGTRLAHVLNPPPATRDQLAYGAAAWLEWEHALAPVTPDDVALPDPLPEQAQTTAAVAAKDDPGPPPF